MNPPLNWLKKWKRVAKMKSETDKMFGFYSQALDYLCMAVCVQSVELTNLLVDMYEETMKEFYKIKNEGLYKTIHESFFRIWYFNKNKERMNEDLQDIISKGFRFYEKLGYFFNREINVE